MKGVLSIVFLLCCSLLLLDSSTSLPLCVDSSLSIYLFLLLSSFFFSFVHMVFDYRCILFFGVGAPFTLNTTLEFCPYNGSTCCNSTEDAQIQKQFQLKNVSDPDCASLLKSILCAVCSCFSLNFISKRTQKSRKKVYFFP